jgi:hypothetical protein
LGQRIYPIFKGQDNQVVLVKQDNEDRRYTVVKLQNIALTLNVSERVLSRVFGSGFRSGQK